MDQPLSPLGKFPVAENKITSWLDRSIYSRMPYLNNEVLIFVIIILFTILSRFYNLGTRVMSHDESLHTYYSWLLYHGSGYIHNPMMHGPLQFHLIALSYFLFGVSDFVARFPHAIFSILSILLIWKWRHQLGRYGALISAGLMLISPYMLYYGRYARNEVFAGMAGILTLYSILRYFESGKSRYLYLLTFATVLHFTSKETAFIYSAQALLFLLFVFIYRSSRKAWKVQAYLKPFLLSLMLGTTFALFAFGYSTLNKEQQSPDLSPTPYSQEMSQGLVAQKTASPSNILLTISLSAFVFSAILLVKGYGRENIRKERSFDLLMLLGTLILPQLTAFPIKLLGWDPLDYTFNWPLANVNTFFQQGIARNGIVLFVMIILSLILGIWWNKRLWLKNAALFYIIYTLLYTTFFTNGQGFFTGIVGSLGYWLEQQGVQRGSQPWFYFLIIQIPLYEFLPAIGSIVACYISLKKIQPLALPNTPRSNDNLHNGADEFDDAFNGSYTFPLLLWWVLSSLTAFTLAGEKMPWLTYHIALPMILLAGWGLGILIERVDWEKIKKDRSLINTGFVLLFIGSLLGTFLPIFRFGIPFSGKNLPQLQATASFLVSTTTMIASGSGLLYMWKMQDIKQILKLALISFFIVLALLTTRTAIRASFVNYDNATEYLVYAHGARGIKDILNQIEEISNRTSSGYDLAIAYDASAPDTGVSWPFTWYFRDYTNIRPFDQPSKALRDIPVIIVDQKNFTKIEPVVGDAYYRFDYTRLWWPNQDYFTLTWKDIWNVVKTPELRSSIFEIWLNRDYSKYSAVTGRSGFTLTDWVPSDQMRLYIRKDIASSIWNYGIGASSTAEIVADPYEKGQVLLQANTIIGGFGQENGQFNAPRGIAAAPDGSIFIADSRNNRIQHFSSDGAFIASWGTYADGSKSPVPLGMFNEPWDLAVSPDGKWVYVADTWNHRIQKFSANGAPITTWGIPLYGQGDPLGFWGPRGIAVDSFGHVFVTDTGNKRIVITDEDGNYLGQLGSAGMEPGQFDEPVGIAFDRNGHLYVADTWNQRIQIFSPDETGLNFTFTSEWEISGWYGQSLDSKPYISVSKTGYVFITDPDNSRVIEFDRSGTYNQTWAGNMQDPFNVTSGLAIDELGNVWVVDSGNNRILQFKSTTN